MHRYRLGLAAVLGVHLASAAALEQPAQPAVPPPAAPAVAAANSQGAVLSGDQVVQILDETVDWYRTLGTQQQTATQPSDLLMLYANQQTANEVIALAFDLARANAELLSSDADNAAQSAGNAASSSQALEEQQKKLQAQRQLIQGEMDTDRRGLAAGQKGNADLQVKLSELQGELDMINARKNLLDTMVQFVNVTDSKTASANALKAHIDAIAVSVPPAGTPTAPGPANPAANAAASPAKSSTASVPALYGAAAPAPSRTGIWGLAENALRLSAKIRTISAIDRSTAALEQTYMKARARPLQQLQALSARSDALATQADNAHGAALKAVRDQLDTLAWLFKQTSDILIPLSKEGVLLQQYRNNLKKWREAVDHQYRDALAALAVRVVILFAMLAIVFAGGEVWRRVVLRYTHEPHRRHQLLLLRTVTTWTVVAAIVAFTFVTELSSFATFAGLLTAGLAVAMQSVLVSLVGYFFLIGKYGVRVGDRVQIGNVTGEVIDLGLVRMHLMELSPQGPLGATGRVVAFANSIVFQASSGLFKQIPGVNFTWHESTVSLPAGCDYAAVRDRLLAALVDVVKGFHEEIVRQTRQIEKATASSSVGSAMPQVLLHFSPTGVEALVRYPVPLEHEAEIDELVSKQIMQIISSSAAGAGHAA